MHRLLHANLHFLDQARALLERLDDQTYSQPVESFYGSTIGGHLRHCLEHYLSLLNGIESGRVDYDDRNRDLQLETVACDAVQALKRVGSELTELLSTDPPVGLLVKMDCGSDEVAWQPSTMGRELQFLVSHTVHHFAMIGGICRALKVAVERDFGVAPSTLRHRASLQSA